MKKVLFVSPLPENAEYVGGIAVFAQSIRNETKYFESKEIRLSFFDLIQPQRVNERKHTSKISRAIFYLYDMIKLNTSLNKEVQKFEYDIIHYCTSRKITLIRDLLLINNVRKNHNIRIFLHIHYADISNILTNNKYINIYLVYLIKKNIDKIIFLSNKTSKEFMDVGIQEKKIAVLYNFFNIDNSKLIISEKMQKALTKEKLDIVFMGSIDQRKGIFDLLSAVSKIHYKKYTLHICGKITDNSLKNKFRQQTEELGGSVIFHGYIKGEEKIRILINGDIFVLPSYGEGMPLAILEAMATGCAVITTNVGAIPEIIDENIGVILAPGEITGIAKAIEDFESNRTRLAKMINMSYTYSSKYSISAFLYNLECLYMS